MHGDSAFAGQGVVVETLNLSQLRGYRTGGTIHVVINNQVGFTTSPEASRSSFYATDVAKTVQAPILHVNGDDPEAVVRVARLAFAYRETFHRDIVIDLICYRRHGHNEADDPSYTQPRMYDLIDNHRSVRKLYTESLVRRGDISLEQAEEALEDFEGRLQQAFEETKQAAPPEPPMAILPEERGVLATVDTSVDRGHLDRIAAVQFEVPDGFHRHPKLDRIFTRARERYDAEQIDWALGETLAFGSLLLEGIDVRLAGQDSRRGTFSHRHAVQVDYHSGEEYLPLANLSADQGRWFVYDSLLSEYAALGFEYGYAVQRPEALTCWEAQFGDFVNGAQIVIDQFIVAAEDKWGETSGLVLLLPHGYEGQGPEHSSARIERFLVLAAEDNIQVVNATTSAQYFHVLRRQMHRDVRKPLVIFTPKSLLRSPDATSDLSAFTDGRFHEVIDDPAVEEGTLERDEVATVLLCFGKVAYELMRERDRREVPAAVVRVEQLYPFPSEQLTEVLAAYPSATDVCWVQEEPENMGAWGFVDGRLWNLLESLGGDRRLRRCHPRAVGLAGRRPARGARAGARAAWSMGERALSALGSALYRGTRAPAPAPPRPRAARAVPPPPLRPALRPAPPPPLRPAPPPAAPGPCRRPAPLWKAADSCCFLRLHRLRTARSNELQRLSAVSRATAVSCRRAWAPGAQARQPWQSVPLRSGPRARVHRGGPPR
jgi:multifunctional 2-oxoglutarate metabolism enzyme